MSIRGMSGSMSRAEPVLVIGAGIIGVTIALELQRRGREVVMLERDAPGRGASFGNMASIAVTDFLPGSRPAVWAKIPRWLIDPDGPVRLRAGHAPRMIPWLLRFVAAGMPGRLREIEAAAAALCHRALDDTQALLHDAGLSAMLSEEGCLSLYEDERELKGDGDHVAMLDRFGFRYRQLTGAEARELEPALSPRIRHVILLPQNRSIRDPYRLVLALVERFRHRGGRIERGEAVAIEHGDGLVVRTGDGQRRAAGQIVVAAGAWSGALARQLNEPIPLETERGYHTQIMAPGVSLKHALIWPARAFMVTPIGDGIRVGGTVELAGLTAPPDYRRAEVTVRHAQRAIPGLQCRDFTRWMGHRPALPDTIPVISASSTTRGVFHATGHGHLGLTYAATTARLMGQLMAGEAPDIDLRPYRIDRF